jgi:5-methylthioadenosine/S-adenosylhomocysteine deaminase
LIIDASIRLQFPALSTQTHTPGSRCCAPRIPIGLWRSISLGAGRDGRLYTPEDSSVANLHGALDTLNGGITTLYGWSHNNNSAEHWDASVQGLKDGGMRGVFGYGNANAEWFPPSTLPTNCDDFRRGHCHI